MAASYRSASAAALCSAVLCTLQGISSASKVSGAVPRQEGPVRKPRGCPAGDPAASKAQGPRGSAPSGIRAPQGAHETPPTTFCPCLLVTGLGLQSRPPIDHWPVTKDLRGALADLPGMAEAADFVVSAYIKVGPGPQPGVALVVITGGWADTRKAYELLSQEGCKQHLVHLLRRYGRARCGRHLPRNTKESITLPYAAMSDIEPGLQGLSGSSPTGLAQEITAALELMLEPADSTPENCLYAAVNAVVALALNYCNDAPPTPAEPGPARYFAAGIFMPPVGADAPLLAPELVGVDGEQVGVNLTPGESEARPGREPAHEARARTMAMAPQHQWPVDSAGALDLSPIDLDQLGPAPGLTAEGTDSQYVLSEHDGTHPPALSESRQPAVWIPSPKPLGPSPMLRRRPVPVRPGSANESLDSLDSIEPPAPPQAKMTTVDHVSPTPMDSDVLANSAHQQGAPMATLPDPPGNRQRQAAQVTTEPLSRYQPALQPAPPGAFQRSPPPPVDPAPLPVPASESQQAAGPSPRRALSTPPGSVNIPGLPRPILLPPPQG